MRRPTWVAILILGWAMLGCNAEPQEAAEPPPSPASEEQADFSQARAEWEPAAEQGDAEAQRQLGVMYYLGQGSEIDYGKALDWLGKAAAQGDGIAQMFLGVMHAEGHGVERDNVKALMWYALSSEQANPGAIHRLEELMQTMSPEEIEQARQMAAQWQPSP